MKIVVFSDLHYLDRRCEDGGNRKLTECSIPLFKLLLDKVNNEIKPDVCIHLGDLIQDTENHDEDIKNIKYVWNLFQRFKVPFYTLLGNHDLKMMNSRKEIEKIFNYDSCTFSIDIDGYHLVFLCTDVNEKFGIQNGGILRTQCVPKDDLEWLRRDLQKNDLPTLLFTHFGVAEDDMKGNFWFETDIESALLKNRDDVKKIIMNCNNILAVFSGHQHWTKKIVENGIAYYIVGSLVENINGDDRPDGVYYIIDVNGDKVDVLEKHLEL